MGRNGDGGEEVVEKRELLQSGILQRVEAKILKNEVAEMDRVPMDILDIPKCKDDL